LNNNLGTLEVYYTAGGANFASQPLLWSGLANNGTAKYTGSSTWQQWLPGEGGFTAIDPNNQNVVYQEWPNGDMHRTADGGLTWGSLNTLPLGSQSLYVAPFVMDPNSVGNTKLSQHLVLGKDAVFETTDSGSTWCQISQGFGVPIS